MRLLQKKSSLRLYLRRHAKFGEDRTIRGRVICVFSIFKMAAVRMDLIGRHIGPPTTCI